MKDSIKNNLKNLNNGELFECQSAFNGLCIYRKTKFINCRYKYSDNSIITLNDKCLYNNIKAVNSRPLLKLSIDESEHISFHKEAILNYNAQIRISPEYLFVGEQLLK